MLNQNIENFLNWFSEKESFIGQQEAVSWNCVWVAYDIIVNAEDQNKFQFHDFINQEIFIYETKDITKNNDFKEDTNE